MFGCCGVVVVVVVVVVGRTSIHSLSRNFIHNFQLFHKYSFEKKRNKASLVQNHIWNKCIILIWLVNVYVCRGNKTFMIVLFLYLVMMWHTHIEGRPHTHTLYAVGRVWASNRVKSVSLRSTWLADILYASCFSLFKAIKDIESF